MHDDNEITFTHQGRKIVVSRFCDYTDYEIGEMADVWDVVIDGEFYEGGYGTSTIAMRAARQFIDNEAENLEAA
jgi:hypothetical protein